MDDEILIMLGLPLAILLGSFIGAIINNYITEHYYKQAMWLTDALFIHPLEKVGLL